MQESEKCYNAQPLPPENRGAGFWCIAALSVLCLIFGWRLFWFLTDDAYIAFRYISNSMRGFGYVWNPPPFLPVEGYTSFLWVVLLDVIWRISGFDPPVSANYISLLFSVLNLMLSFEMLFRSERHHWRKGQFLVFQLLFAAYLLTNRSYLTWSSSGLETAMFCFLIINWVFVILLVRNRLRLFSASLLSVLLALTRPDGLLFCASTFVLLLIELLFPKKGTTRKQVMIAVSPFLLVIGHLLWRHSLYGEWLPNTYYAKIVEAWPKSGAIYLFSYIMEFCLWPIAILVIFASLGNLYKNRDILLRRSALSYFFSHRDLTLVIGTLTAHLCYYTFIAGGDHFEYRPYNHLPPLIFLSLIWALRKIHVENRLALAVATLCVIASLPVQWSHWRLTHNRTSRNETLIMRVPITPIWPTMFHWYSVPYDKAQDWLISHLVCVRHQEHKIFTEILLNTSPTREEGMQYSSEGFPIYATTCVGVGGWILRNVYILDLLGLNDYVIARTPVPQNSYLAMAHTRLPPEGYVESFHPNVEIVNKKVNIKEREKPLTERDIISLERKWRRVVGMAEKGKMALVTHSPSSSPPAGSAPAAGSGN